MRKTKLSFEAPRRRRKSVQLWTVLAIALTLIAFRLCEKRPEATRRFFEPLGLQPFAEILPGLLFAALMVLLWIAYREWRDSLRRESEFQRVIASISPDVLIVVNPDRTITACNSAVKAMFGLEPSEVIGGKTDQLYFDRRVNGHGPGVFESLKEVGFHVGSATGKRREGSPFPIELITGLLQGRDGAVILLRDITERRRMEEQLVHAKEEAESANRATSEALSQLDQNFKKLKKLEDLRDQLTHMIVHDLKSPLSAIGGYLDILRSQTAGRLPADEAECIAEALSLTRKMGEMILSMLDLHRLDNNEMPLNRQSCDLAQLARDAIDLVGRRDRGPRLSAEAPAGPAMAFCDPEVIRRVIVNLLDNALKFTPESGWIEVRVEPGGTMTRVSVKDSGSGIPPEFHKKIFQRFAQVETRKYSTGLGLAFCDMAVRAHGGMIGVESQPGKGTTLWFVLPVAPAANPAP
jgi:PAS domain S-box-containing protein